MEKVTGTVSGKLVIGASMIPGEYMVPQLLARFKKAYPDVFPILRIADSNDIYESVLQSEIVIHRDFYVITHRLRFNSLICRSFIEFLSARR